MEFDSSAVTKCLKPKLEVVSIADQRMLDKYLSLSSARKLIDSYIGIDSEI
jgi:hypothetical protein